MNVVERIITIEYLNSKMSTQIAGKFPDESIYGFDYDQSGIWSPLLPRTSYSDHSSCVSSSHKKGRRVQNRSTQIFYASVSKPKKPVKKNGKGKARNLGMASAKAPKKCWYRLFGAASKSLKKKQSCPSLPISDVDGRR